MSLPTVRLNLVAFWAVFTFWMVQSTNAEPGDPIKTGFGTGGRQDWGHATVRPDTHIFWWLQYTTAPGPTDAHPLAIWFQGGPGAASSGYGNFEELGVLEADGITPRNYTWVKTRHVLYVDAPVGAGFSYAATNSAFSRTDEGCVADMLQLLRSFYAARPDFAAVPVDLFGESYGGKLVMLLALAWHKALQAGNAHETLPNTLRSVNSIDGWVSPIHSMQSWSPFLYNLGFIEAAGKARIDEAVRKTQAAIKAGHWAQATDLWGYTEMLISAETGEVDFYNVLKAESGEEPVETAMGLRRAQRLRRSPRLQHQQLMSQMYRLLVTRQSRQPPVQQHNLAAQRDAEVSGMSDADRLSQLMNGKVREKLGIPEHIVWGGQSDLTFQYMEGAFMRPAVNAVEAMLNDSSCTIKVNVCNGQLDLIVATPGTVEWLRSVRWSGAEQFAAMKRQLIVTQPDGRVEGFYKQLGQLGYWMLLRAGHMLPADNPPGMAELLRHVTGVA